MTAPAPAWSWEGVAVGTTVEFLLTAKPFVEQAYAEGEPLFWVPEGRGRKTTTPTGIPVEKVVLEATVNGQPTRLSAIIRGESLFFAIQHAAGYSSPEPGDVLRVTFLVRMPPSYYASFCRARQHLPTTPLMEGTPA